MFVISDDSTLRGYSESLCTPNQDQLAAESAGCKATVLLFNGSVNDSLALLLYSYLCKKVAAGKTFVTPE